MTPHHLFTGMFGPVVAAVYFAVAGAAILVMLAVGSRRR